MGTPEPPREMDRPSPTPGLARRPSLHAAVLALGATLPYANTLGAPFTLDDGHAIVRNPALRGLFDAPGRALADLAASNFPRLVGNLTFALNFATGGLDVTGYHAVNIAIHLLATLLVYRLVSLTYRTPSLSSAPPEALGDGPLVALFAALLFACHPVATQAVTYVVQRFASLATLFYLLALVLYAGARLSTGRAGRRARLAGALVAALLGTLTKEICFTLPLALALYELFFFEGPARPRVWALAPFLLTLPILPLAYLRPAGPALDLDAVDASLRASADPAGPGRLGYLLTQLRVLVTYLRLLALPVGQNVDYDYPVSHSPLEPAVVLSAFLLAALLATGLWLAFRSRRPGEAALRVPAFGVLWFFVTSSVESTFFPLADVIFEHRLYLPSVGLFLAVVALAFEARRRLAVPAGRLLVPALSALAVLLGAAAFARNEVWRDEVRLWEDAARKSPAKPRPHLWLGWLYLRDGRVDDAAREVEAAVRLGPGVAAYDALGVVRVRQGRYGEARASYERALDLDPSAAEVHDNLGLLYKTLGQTEAAEREYLEALRLRPGYADAHNDLGALYAREGRLEEAIREFQAALAASPIHAGARRNLETALRQSGR